MGESQVHGEIGEVAGTVSPPLGENQDTQGKTRIQGEFTGETYITG